MEEKEEKKRKKGSVVRRIAQCVFAISFLFGFGVLIYPYVADQWNTWRQQKLITTYREVISSVTENDLSDLWLAAWDYNNALGSSNVYADVFDSDEESIEETEYWQVLNVNNDGIMGYISIPKINLSLPIYHGTDESVLQHGIGHMSGSQLPIGGEGNHAVLAGHRGLATATLFTNLDQLEIGDVFYIYILDEVLAYEVDQILPMVDKDDTETLQEALSSVEGEDYVTLFTCTPFGVNSHRLLVRGSRIEYVAEEEDAPTVTETIVQSVRTYYIFYVLIGMVVTAFGILIVRILMKRSSKRRQKSRKQQAANLTEKVRKRGGS